MTNGSQCGIIEEQSEKITRSEGGGRRLKRERTYREDNGYDDDQYYDDRYDENDNYDNNKYDADDDYNDDNYDEHDEPPEKQHTDEKPQSSPPVTEQPAPEIKQQPLVYAGTFVGEYDENYQAAVLEQIRLAKARRARADKRARGKQTCGDIAENLI